MGRRWLFHNSVSSPLTLSSEGSDKGVYDQWLSFLWIRTKTSISWTHADSHLSSKMLSSLPGNFTVCTTPPFQMKLREAKKLAHSHALGRRWIQDSNPAWFWSLRAEPLSGGALPMSVPGFPSTLGAVPSGLLPRPGSCSKAGTCPNSSPLNPICDIWSGPMSPL